MADPWFEVAIREHANKHGPSGDGWNISMVLDRLRQHDPASASDTQDIELHTSRRHPFLVEENLQESRRHERSQDERLAALEHGEAGLETEMKKAMADIDTLMGILSGISSDASSLSDDFKNLEGQLQAAQSAAANNQPVDLTNAILTARNAQAALDAVVQSAASVGAAPAPAPASAGGDTSGGASDPTAQSTSAAAGGSSDPTAQSTSTAAGASDPTAQSTSTAAPTDQNGEVAAADTPAASADASGATGGDGTGTAASGDGTSGASGGDGQPA